MNAKIRTIGLLVMVVAVVAAKGLGELRGQDSEAIVDENPIADPAVESDFVRAPTLEHRPTDETKAASSENGSRFLDESDSIYEPPRADRGWANPYSRAWEAAAMERAGREPSFTQQLYSLKSTLSSPDASDEQKSNAKQEIEALLNQYFDEDIKARQAKITEIEQRIAKLKAQLERRRAAKGELVQLQMKLIENEAAGLGFFGTDDARRMRGIPQIIHSRTGDVFYSVPPDPAAPAAPRR